MNQTVKRGVALLMAIVMCIGLLPALHLSADAANVDYVTSPKGYIYNWGTRGETATFLSQNAEDFYTSGNAYEDLSALSGGTSASSAPSSELYAALQKLMKDNHKWITSYNDTKDLYQYTDCENSGNPKTISSFYSGKAIGPAWDGGSTWNREHTWPNSKGDASNQGENDIMMLRPTAKSENGSRGNTAYGESSGFYNPNSESGGKYDLRGDVARIMLYVYVRWGNTGSMWGSSGVIESLEVLLKWMEADPVDTWELGRNDSVQSMTGTRNVFVDYPELAFLLFGASVPGGMSTPSQGAGDGHVHSFTEVVTAPTCTEEGYTTYTCDECGYSRKGDIVPALGHHYEGGKCTACGADAPSAGDAAYVRINTLAELVSGQYVLIAEHGYGPTVLDGTWLLAGQPAVDGDTVADPQGCVWTITVTDSGVKLTDANGVTVAPKGGNNNGIKSGDYVWTVTVNEDGTFCFAGTGSDTVKLASNTGSENKFRGYKNATVSGNPAGYPSNFALYVLTGGSEVEDPDNHEHSFTLQVAEEKYLVSTATCTAKAIYYYSCACGEMSEETFEYGDFLPHAWGEWGQYIDPIEPTADKEGVRARHCENCGKIDMEVLDKVENTLPQSAGKWTAQIASFQTIETASSNATVTKLVTDVSTLNVGDKIIIVASGYDKALSTTQNGNNRGAAAVTKDGDTVTYGEDVQIIVLEAGTVDGTFSFYVENYYDKNGNLVESGYLYAAGGTGKNNYLRTYGTLDDRGSWTIEIEDGSATIKTVDANTARNWMRFNSANNPQLFSCYGSGQADISIYKIETTGSGEPEPCEHSYASVVTAPTCTEKGYTTYTCSKCGDSYTGDETDALGHDEVNHEAKAPTCTEAGWDAYVTCSRCDYTTYLEKAALGHHYDNGICTECGALDETEHTHSWGEWEDRLASDCEKEGLRFRHCSACGKIDVEALEAPGHTWGEWTQTKTPTCINQGEETRICSACGETETRMVETQGHTSVVAPGYDATCTESGKTDGQICLYCGLWLTYQQDIAPLGHTWLDATYEAPKTCAVCGVTEGEPLKRPPVEVDTGDVVITAPEGVDADKAQEIVDSLTEAAGAVQQPETGIDSNTAVIESAKENIKDENGEKIVGNSYETSLNITMGKAEIAAEGEDTVVVRIVYEVTPYLYALSEDGSVLGEAKLNNFETEVTFRLPLDKNLNVETVKVLHEGELLGYFKVQTDENGNKFVEVKSKNFSEFAVEAHNHEYTAEVTAPTCTTAGFTTYTCACGDTYTADEVSALGHTEVVDAAVAATCTETGLTEGKHCSVCGEVLAPRTEVPATGHNFGQWTVTKEATEQAEGEETRTCACGEKETRSIPKLEPAPTEPTEPKPTEPKPTEPQQPGEESGSNTVVIVIVVVVVLGVAAAAVFLFLNKKKRA